MSRPRLSTIVVALLALALAAFWYFSPYLTLYSMRQAAQADDAKAVAEHVDFPRVRESLKEQFGAALADRIWNSARGRSDTGRLGAALGTLAGGLLGDRFIDAVVTPEGLAAAMREGKVLAARGQAPAPEALPQGQPQQQPGSPGQGPEPAQGLERADARRHVDWAVERQGVNVFIAHARTSDRPAALDFVFERAGFASWKLVRLELPAQG